MNYRTGLLQLLLVGLIAGLVAVNALVAATPASQDTCPPPSVTDKSRHPAKPKTRPADKAKAPCPKADDKAPARPARSAGKTPADKAPSGKPAPDPKAKPTNADQPPPKDKPQQSGKESEDPLLKKLKEQTQKLSLEEQAAAARLAAELRQAKQEIQRLQTQMELESTRQKAQLSKLQRAKAELEARIELEKAKIKSEVAARELQLERRAAEIALKNKQLELELADRELEIKKIKADIAYKDAQMARQLADKVRETQKLSAEIENLTAKMNRQELSLKQKLARTAEQMTLMKADLALANQREQCQEQVTQPIKYLKNPYQNGRLVISDRRIELNGPIWTETARHVSERLHFFNNQSTELPIFIVIDSSPGGSVMSGAQILQAIASSKAPVHVVVKRFAASMAAVITTLAPHSYAYPNAIILHHQPSSSNAGNVTQQKEGLQMIQKWEKRFGGPVAKKMGLTLEAFRKQMYKHNSDGDWMAFADEAVKLKWVDHLVTDCHEQGIRKKPQDSGGGLFIFFQKDGSSPIGKIQYDQQGAAYVKLPPLADPFDVWYLYNPNRFYR